MTTAPLVSLITLNYNQSEVTCALLKSIRTDNFLLLLNNDTESS